MKAATPKPVAGLRPAHPTGRLDSRLLLQCPDAELPALTADEVRDTLERVRR